MAIGDVFKNLATALSGVSPVGVIHVGAHDGQETPSYIAFGFGRIVLVEPNPAHSAVLTERAKRPGVSYVPGAVSNSAGSATLHVTVTSQLSSLRRPLRDDVASTVDVPTFRLADLQHDCNVLVVDVQGHEWDVLTSGDLALFDAAIVEESWHIRYEGERPASDIQALLIDSGFVEKSRYPKGPGLADIVWRRP